MEQPFLKYKNPRSLSYGNIGQGANRDLLANRGRMRRYGAYDSQNFDFSNYDDGSPVRIR